MQYAEYQDALKAGAKILSFIYGELSNYFKTQDNSEAATNCNNSAEFYAKVNTWQTINEGMADNIEERLAQHSDKTDKQLQSLRDKESLTEYQKERLVQLEAKQKVLSDALDKIGEGMAVHSEAVNQATFDWAGMA